MERRNYSSGGPYEPIVGYSRAVRVGASVHVAGTTALDASGKIVGAGNAHAQAVQIFRNIGAALRGLDCDFEDVVRTRIFITNAADWEAVGRAHGEVFRDIRPACTLVVVSRLVDPAMLVEIEADAVVP